MNPSSFLLSGILFIEDFNQHASFENNSAPTLCFLIVNRYTIILDFYFFNAF